MESRVNKLTYHIVTPEAMTIPCQQWKTPPAVLAVTYCTEEDGPELYPLEKGGKEAPELNTQLSAPQQMEVKTLLEQFGDVFSNEPGNTHLITHSIDTGEAKSSFPSATSSLAERKSIPCSQPE